MKRICISVLMFIALCTSICQAGTDPQAAMQYVRKNLEAADEQSTVTLTLSDDRGQTSQRTFTFWQALVPGNDRVRVRFISPEHMRGLQLLTLGNEQYLKPIGLKLRKIAFNEKGKSFAQSEFFYEDLEGFKASDYTYTLVKDGDIVEIDATPTKASVYDKLTFTVDAKRHVFTQIKYFDKANQLWKTEVDSDFSEVKPGIWRSGTVMMTNHLNGRKTTVVFSNRNFSKLSPSIFSLSQLED